MNLGKVKVGAIEYDLADFKNIADVEETSTASKAYNKGEFLIYDGTLYEVIANISANDTLTVNTNIEETTVGKVLTTINTALSTKESLIATLKHNTLTANVNLSNYTDITICLAYGNMRNYTHLEQNIIGNTLINHHVIQGMKYYDADNNVIKEVLSELEVASTQVVVNKILIDEVAATANTSWIIYIYGK